MSGPSKWDKELGFVHSHPTLLPVVPGHFTLPLPLELGQDNSIKRLEEVGAVWGKQQDMNAMCCKKNSQRVVVGM